MRQPRRKPFGNAGRSPKGGQAKPVGVRIIAGQFRGRKLLYAVDPRTRPMKDRVRQALFNRLGPAVQGKVAIDLFAGTGALGFEALSRGAARAVLVEHPGMGLEEVAGIEAEIERLVGHFQSERHAGA